MATVVSSQGCIMYYTHNSKAILFYDVLRQLLQNLELIEDQSRANFD